MSKIPVIIDVDTGIDDALALVMACASDKLDIRGITTVSGNVGLEHTTRNTLNVLDLLGCGNLPVAAGADRPIARKPFKASLVHGLDGLRGYKFEKNVDYALQKEPAWDFMRNILMDSAEKMTLIALGPVTNLAILLEKYPEVKDKIERIVFMGASYHCGNPGPVQTFNVLVDPEGFREVIRSGIPFYAVPLDTTRKAYITDAEKKPIEEMSGPAAKLVKGTLLGYCRGNAVEEKLELGEDEEQHNPKRDAKNAGKSSLHDPATVTFVTNPELFTVSGPYYCDVECKGELTDGWTLIDMEDWYCKEEEEKNFFFVDSVNREDFIQLFYDSVRHFSN